MKTIANQILAGTRLDKQGERNSKEVLEKFASSVNGQRLPLNQQHDVTLPVIGHVDDLRVVPDSESPGDWQLIGNVVLYRDDVDPDLRGFSFSYLEILVRSKTQESLQLFLPFPHYGNSALINEMFEDGFTSVGKVVRKNASPETVAIIVSVAVVLIQPIWEDVFRSLISPAIVRFFKEKFVGLQQHSIGCNLVQHIGYSGHNATVHFVPVRGMEETCFSTESLYAGMLLVSEYLNSLEVNHIPAQMIIMHFDPKQEKFRINKVHFADGVVKSDF